LYDKAHEVVEGKGGGRRPETRFSFVDYDVCASPSDTVLRPVIDLIDAGPTVLTSPCALRVVTATPPKNKRLAREAHEARQALVESVRRSWTTIRRDIGARACRWSCSSGCCSGPLPGSFSGSTHQPLVT
jgi:hypothetical protein